MVASGTAPLIETKLTPPRGRGIGVPRARLTDLLDEVVEVPLTVVSAPAGFGKTTLLVDWYERASGQVPVAWFSLDETDNDPDQFARYLREAAGRAFGWPPDADGPLTVEAVVSELVNRVASSGPAIVVLDDYHLIESGRVHSALAFLLEHQPPNLHLVIGSRRDPPLPLPRLRARDRLLELRAEDLRFTTEEAAALLLQLTDGSLSEQQTATLEARTEGWAAALQLAALSVQRSDDVGRFVAAFGGSNRFVFDYLAEEVFEAQDAETQLFLLRTSVLDRLSGPLCDAVTGLDGGVRRLSELMRANLFTVALDEEGRWYRYHHLFRDFLRRLIAERAPGEAPELHRRAAAWFAAHDLLDEAYPHAVAGEDTPLALELLRRLLPGATMRGEILTPGFERWLRDIPPREVERRPSLALPLALSYVMAGRVTEADSLVGHVEAILDGREVAAEPVTERERTGHHGTMRTAQAYIARYRGRPEEALAIAEAGMAEVPPDHRTQAWLRMVRQLVRYEAWAPNLSEEIEQATIRCFRDGHLGGALGLMTLEFYHLVLCGRLRDAGEHLERSLMRAYDRNALPAVGMLHGAVSELHYERGELDDAEDEASRCADLGAPGATPGVWTPPEATLARIQIVDGRRDEARQSLGRLEERARPVETVQGRRFFPALAAHLRLRLGDLSAVGRWADEVSLTPDVEPTFENEYSCLVYARFLIAADRAREAMPLLARVAEGASNAGRHGRAMEARLLEACARWRAGDERAASAAFAQVLPMAEREGYARTLLDEGEPALAMLRQAARSGAHATYATRLLVLAGDAPSARTGGGPDALSERELDVLRLLSRGYSNREIADEIVVSLDTVKTHLKNIYSKLGVHSRTQAIGRARETGAV